MAGGTAWGLGHEAWGVADPGMPVPTCRARLSVAENMRPCLLACALHGCL